MNNFLAGIMGRSYIGKNARSLDKAKRLFASIEADGNKAAALVNELMIFSRDISIDEHHCDARDIVTTAVKTARLAIPENIEISLRIDGDEFPVFANAGQIEQVILNMIYNARDALAETPAPHIDIRLRKTRQALCTGRRSPDCAACDGEKLLLTISDNGHGIPADIQGRIFEPFYTTKQPGTGTGLGLSTAFQTVQRHHGSIFVESGPGQGTRFGICLPLSDGAAIVPDEERSTQIQPGQQETILLIDDDPSLLCVSTEVLQELNYRVTGTGNGREALEIFRRRQHEIALVMTDIVMPGMNGDAAVREMKKIRPDLPVIFTSGYSDIEIDTGVSTRFVRKPFHAAELSRLLREVLRQEGASPPASQPAGGRQRNPVRPPSD